MKLKFKHQKFQEDAVKAVVEVFRGQPNGSSSYMIDKGKGFFQQSFSDEEDFTGWGNRKIIASLTDEIVLKRINEIQKRNRITPSDTLEGRYNLTIDMETGVGKTYTYIKTMYELNKQYGWSKYIVVVPSIAVREAVYKTFQMTEEHFSEEYGKKIRYFIYDSARLIDIDRFASDNNIHVMIINSQAFNATGKDARRIGMRLDDFRSRRPIDVIAAMRPILIIDEPQSTEGKETRIKLKDFNPLITLRYSATHRRDSIYNMVYRLDAVDAYNQKLVKKIAVKGITEIGEAGTEGYVYLESINLSKKAPTATVQFDLKGVGGLRKITRVVSEGYNLYEKSGNLSEYKEGFTVLTIDGRDNSLTFVNGIKLYVGTMIGKVSEEQKRKIQIRETILSHIERERALFSKEIKVLSLFFIDEVKHYRAYSKDGEAKNGLYAEWFEEIYDEVIKDLKMKEGEEEYFQYLKDIPTDKTHSGYFSIDKKGKMTNSTFKKKEAGTDDVSAYDLIMKNKELLLERDPKKSPVRFLFSHSALKEGWDNPNVFQICTLKQSTSEVRKRQEVGRGLRLAVNKDGERMDVNVLGEEVHKINVLTLIASESYDKFAEELQNDIAKDLVDRPKTVTAELFVDKKLTNNNGESIFIDSSMAHNIQFDLIVNGYIDKEGKFKDKYYDDKRNGSFLFSSEIEGFEEEFLEILENVFDEKRLRPEDAKGGNVELNLEKDKLVLPEFKALWEKINAKSVYVVNFDSAELIEKSISAINHRLNVTKLRFKVESGEMKVISSKEALEEGKAFIKENTKQYTKEVSFHSNLTYDLVGEVAKGTKLTRKAVIEILKGIKAEKFELFKENPEEFIMKTAKIINEEKSTAIINHITYNVLDEKYDTSIFTEPNLKGRLGYNVTKTKKHLYDHIIYDSKIEEKFAKDLDINKDVAVYVKLPNEFFINTPVGKYNPDWAIAFYKGNVKHIYFVAETKGSMDSLSLREYEKTKKHCAIEHFKAISNGEVVYDIINNYDELLNKVMK